MEDKRFRASVSPTCFHHVCSARAAKPVGKLPNSGVKDGELRLATLSGLRYVVQLYFSTWVCKIVNYLLPKTHVGTKAYIQLPMLLLRSCHKMN